MCPTELWENATIEVVGVDSPAAIRDHALKACVGCGTKHELLLDHRDEVIDSAVRRIQRLRTVGNNVWLFTGPELVALGIRSPVRPSIKLEHHEPRKVFATVKDIVQVNKDGVRKALAARPSQVAVDFGPGGGGPYCAAYSLQGPVEVRALHSAGGLDRRWPAEARRSGR